MNNLNTLKSLRPDGYQYIDILKSHVGNNFNNIFNNKQLIYPRQMEVHLPGDHVRSCNFECSHCQGKLLERPLGQWEEKGLRLMEKLKGKIPYYIYGGAYTEPLLNKYLLDYLQMTKKYENNFGIHTNGSLLLELEKDKGFSSQLVQLANSPLDYISISLDAGQVASHCKIKNIELDWFSQIIEGIRLLKKIRGAKQFPLIRVCYLMNKINCSEDEINNIVETMKEINVDSLRFSVPYDLYGKDFKIVENYRDNHEIPFGKQCARIVGPYLSKTSAEKPFIIWHAPGYQDINKMCFSQCIYSYYQITYAADGMIYKCSSTASPSFLGMQLGKITDDLDEFNEQVKANHNPKWNAQNCFSQGARCNRIALEINDIWNKGELK